MLHDFHEMNGVVSQSLSYAGEDVLSVGPDTGFRRRDADVSFIYVQVVRGL